MDPSARRSLNDTLTELHSRISGSASAGPRLAPELRDSLLESAIRVLQFLRSRPYTPAQEVAEWAGADRRMLTACYKLIQGCAEAQQSLKASDNGDFFSVVEHYFNTELFTVVFFVGTSCQNRCVYCPNVRVDSNGKRELLTYGHQASDPTLSPSQLQDVFGDLGQLQGQGSKLLVKVSGGLEPLTDIGTLSCIVAQAEARGVFLKLLTNGVLLRHRRARRVALGTRDIRISLNTADPDQYEQSCLGRLLPPGKRRALHELQRGIHKAVCEKQTANASCRIGLNCIILEFNCDHLEAFLQMAWNLGVDYVDFKPDYRGTSDLDLARRIGAAVKDAQALVRSGRYPGMLVHFCNSLRQDNLYWSDWQGSCDVSEQAAFKMFITPHGYCSPVHCGAFPQPSSVDPLRFCVGQLRPGWGLLDVRQHPRDCPRVPFSLLNPFELMLSLELKRRREDSRWGIPDCCCPYSPSEFPNVPPGLLSGFMG